MRIDINRACMQEPDVARQIRTCVRHLDWAGVDPADNYLWVTLHTYSDEREQWAAWCAHTLMLAWQDIAAGDLLYAFRGLLQACGYKGRRGGFLPSHLDESLSALRNHLEPYLSNRDGGR